MKVCGLARYCAKLSAYGHARSDEVQSYGEETGNGEQASQNIELRVDTI